MAGKSEGLDTGWRYVLGIILLILCLFLALGLLSYDSFDISLFKSPPNGPAKNLIGPVGAWLSFSLFALFGVGAYLVPLWCLVFGSILMLQRNERIWPRAVWSGVLMLCLAMTVELYPSLWRGTQAQLNIPDMGGIIGRLLMQGMMIRWLRVGAHIIVWGCILVSTVMLLGLDNVVRLGRWARARALKMWELWKERKGETKDRRQLIEKEERRIERQRRRLEKSMQKQQKAKPARPSVSKPKVRQEPAQEESVREQRPSPKPKEERKPVEAIKKFFGASDEEKPQEYRLPPLELLEESVGHAKGMESDSSITSRVLIETLAEFGIDVEVTNVDRGPVVTRYELLPAAGVRVERISGLSNNMALALKATSVRVQAPIPGRGTVGIEVPNQVAKVVYLRDILEGDTWLKGKAKVPLVLGQDVAGSDMVADLADMPHMLVAGATGAGKTVCMNSILAGLLMSKTPDQLRLMLVDPKIVEFSVYNHLPHLVVPVITNPKKVALGLRWAIAEMEKRYKLFAKAGVRNIEAYNSMDASVEQDLFSMGDEKKDKSDQPATIPYIVIVIDELADLMLVDQAEIENCVARLAQLSRAVGIHMILSTQRPSVNVLTGTIKANFPARIAFQVAQKVDSRTILDTVGAEKLLGRGDMLFLPPGTSKMIRAQGTMTSDRDIANITAFWKEQGVPDYEVEIKEKLEKKGPVIETDQSDELLERAVEIIRETQRASTSSLQRRLRIGYTRAARIMDILEEKGIIGPPRGSDPREILIDLDGDIPDNADENQPMSAGQDMDEEDEQGTSVGEF